MHAITLRRMHITTVIVDFGWYQCSKHRLTELCDVTDAGDCNQLQRRTCDDDFVDFSE